ncbi:hypothetical protein LWI28_007909 [Acer negundo]|uniref:Uncharacterized protein n=1 Tax=Acer negundo TaxID=4023 RepID=A0AAD5IR55_ACENE|nr:hypothetical protein LWI28_007909 [Acer negundo]
MRNPIMPLFALLFIVYVIDKQSLMPRLVEAKSNVHIVYLGEKQHDDNQLVVDSHHQMLAEIVGSQEEASKLMVYNYKHSFSGFAAKLTDSQAQLLSGTCVETNIIAFYSSSSSIEGQGIFTEKEIDFTDIIYAEETTLRVASEGESQNPPLDASLVAGKVVLIFPSLYHRLPNATKFVKAAGAVGIIFVRTPDDTLLPCDNDFACIEVDFYVGTQILLYTRSTRSPVVKFSPAKTFVGQPLSANVAYFSSRGPNSIAPAILKPDIAAPGVNIIAASSPLGQYFDNGFDMLTGTSMATPHLSGIVALLKSAHPDWTPAAIKSALVTTAWKNGPSGSPIFAHGASQKLADPFDLGGGVVNPNKAADPGLVYDMTTTDYIHYLCAMSYSNSAISRLTGKPTMCPSKKPSILDVNVPSITIPSLRNCTTLTRTVTNVGEATKTIYKAAIEPPLGIMVSVNPEVLVFDAATNKISYRVTVSTTYQVNTGFFFGSLTWTNGVHAVRIPISVKTEIMPA